MPGCTRLQAAEPICTRLQAAELAHRPTPQRLIRATAAVAGNLWRRLPDRLEVKRVRT